MLDDYTKVILKGEWLACGYAGRNWNHHWMSAQAWLFGVIWWSSWLTFVDRLMRQHRNRHSVGTALIAKDSCSINERRRCFEAFRHLYFFPLDLIPSNASQKCVTTVPQSACSQVSTVLFYAWTAKFVWAQICVQHVETAWVAIRSAWESLKNSSSAKITTSSECSTQWFMLVFCVWIIVIASGVIVLGWLTLNKESQKIDDLPFLATCQSGTSAMLSSKVNSAVVHESTR